MITKKYEIQGIGEEQAIGAVDLRHKITGQNCLKYLEFGKNSGLENLYAQAKAWINWNLTAVVDDESFMNLTNSEVYL